MFSQHPFTIGHRYALDARAALPLRKRAVDLLCCVAGLPLLGLLTFVFTLIGKFSSRGPVFYRQENTGCLGRRFGLYRFRTMRVASPAGVQPGQADPGMVQSQPAFIPGGRFLRTSGLADLPQLVNVLRGEMSVVGPRPCLDPGNSGRGATMNDVTVTPGLTGLWRISTGNQTADDASLRWERTYAENMSVRSDLAIIARTLLAFFGWRRVR